MKVRRVVALVTLSLMASLCLLEGVPFAVAADADDAALAFVQERHLGESLGWLGYQVASRTVIFASIVQTQGRNQAQALVRDELQRLQPEYQAQWDRNLAAAYAQSFTPDELRALNKGDGPPMLANKLKVRQNDVGMDMKARSADLLQDFVSRAMDSALKKTDR